MMRGCCLRRSADSICLSPGSLADDERASGHTELLRLFLPGPRWGATRPKRLHQTREPSLLSGQADQLFARASLPRPVLLAVLRGLAASEAPQPAHPNPLNPSAPQGALDMAEAALQGQVHLLLHFVPEVLHRDQQLMQVGAMCSVTDTESLKQPAIHAY